MMCSSLHARKQEPKHDQWYLTKYILPLDDPRPPSAACLSSHRLTVWALTRLVCSRPVSPLKQTRVDCSAAFLLPCLIAHTSSCFRRGS